VSELRYNPLLGEWTATATVRQDRTFLPPDDYCPLCPTEPGGFPTEIPAETYDIVTFENKFPSLRRDPPEPVIAGDDFYPVRPSKGVCEVVVFTPDHDSTLADQPVEQILKLIMVWTDRTRVLGSLEFIDYVYVFENKGKEVGVTLTHPHGQIYAYPFIPPYIKKELAASAAHFEKHGSCLICDIEGKERTNVSRVIAENETFTAVIPFFARYPYELHIYPRRHLGLFTDLTAKETRDLAEILKRVLVGFDGLFDRSFPYIMCVHQAPTDGGDHGHYHFHIEFFPPMRSANKLKYLAGSEAGAGMFINDTLPEEKAEELRKHIKPVEWAK
jgi:UDPglucose--hexose-1-phosphate uridylyltransferase